VTDQDTELLDRVRTLHRSLTQRTVLLTHVRSDVDAYAEGMRDLGEELHELGADILARVETLDALPVTEHPQNTRVVHLAGVLAQFG
jgi:class 3 adenylate cyclase